MLVWWMIQLVILRTGRGPNEAELRCFLMETYCAIISCTSPGSAT
jgi:hypothetical protein